MPGPCRVEFTGCSLEKTLSVVKTNNEYMAPPYFGCLWELRPFYYHIMKRLMHKWIGGKGRATNEFEARPGRGAAAVQMMAKAILPGIPCILEQRVGFPDAQKPGSTHNHKDKRVKSAVPQTSMVSSGWLLAFLLVPTAPGSRSTVRDKAMEAFEAVVSTVCSGEGFSVAPPLACYVAASDCLLATRVSRHVFVVCCHRVFPHPAALFVPLRSFTIILGLWASAPAACTSRTQPRSRWHY